MKRLTRSRAAFGGWREITTCAAIVGAQLLFASSAQALPSLNPHPNILVGWEDPTGGSPTRNHHHWDPLFPLYPGNGSLNDETPNSPLASVGKSFVNVSFDAYSAWDAAGNQALYRNGDVVQDFGHGFIRTTVPYRFETGANGVPASAVTDLNAAVGTWITDVTTYFNSPSNAPWGPPQEELGFKFSAGAAEDLNFNGVLDTGEDANTNGALDGFTVTWAEGGIPGVLARWRPGRQELEINGLTDWFYGGAGNIPAGKTDFVTIMMHELGHMIGLNHINTGVADRLMRADIFSQAQAAGTTGVRHPDIGSIFGAVALYTQPVPEPATIVFAMMAVIGLSTTRRRRFV